ncbi:paraneoplastic antigen Ma6F-like [Cynocephalus volans]|uniref:paraneoplastic antigen Ma6F-like n=1 Tax=Cynocephalus volans TaxID=110931 RepID=UPI002FC95AD7
MLRDWCRCMSVNEQRSLLILGIPDDCTEDEFQEAVHAALWPLGRQEQPGCGEESSESWLDHIRDMLYLSQHTSEGERRRRLVASLGGRALQLVCGLLEEHPDMPAQDCLAALVQVFGNKDTTMTARLKFLTCSQQPQEALFAYVMRLEGLLQMAMEKGAIHPAMADHMRARQLLLGALPNETLQVKLRGMWLEKRLPGFMDLLRLVRETEAWEATTARNEQLQIQEGAEVNRGDPAGDQGACVDEGAAQASPAVEDAALSSEVARKGMCTTADVSKGSLANEDVMQPALFTADAAEVFPPNENAASAVPDADEAAEATPDTDDTTKAAPATQEDKSAPASAGLARAGPTESPRGPTAAQMGSASGASPGGPGWGPEGLAQAGDQEAEESPLEGLKPILEESGNEEGAGETSHPEPSSGK